MEFGHHVLEGKGVEVRNLKTQIRTQNNSLLFKWLWRFNREENAIWRKTIKEKFGMEDHCITKNPNHSYSISNGKYIRRM